MKIRMGFVSNSSSSSFAILLPKKPESVEDIKDMLEIDDIASKYLWDEIKYWEDKPEYLYDTIEHDIDFEDRILDRFPEHMCEINMNSQYLKEYTEECEIVYLFNELLTRINEYRDNKIKEKLYNESFNNDKYYNINMDDCYLQHISISDEDYIGYNLIVDNVFKNVIHEKKES